MTTRILLFLSLVSGVVAQPFQNVQRSVGALGAAGANQLQGYIDLRNGVFDVRNYGAIGDGTSDDTAAINAAIVAAGANGVVLFDAGKTYKTTSLITVGSDGVVLMGYGATITSATQDQYRKFAFVDRARCAVIGLKFSLLQTDGGGVLGAAAIEISGVSNDMLVRDCLFNDSRGGGVYILGHCTRITVERNTFSRNFCAIFSDDDTTNQPTKLRIAGNRIVNGLGSTSTAYSGGIKLSGTGTINSYAGHVIAGNQIDTPGQMGIELQTWVNGCSVAENTINGAGYAISLSGVSNCGVTGNTAKAFSTYGVELSGAVRSAVTGNVIDASDASGTRLTDRAIQSSASAAQCAISGNALIQGDIYVQNSQAFSVVGNNIYEGEVVALLSQQVVISGNTITSATQGNGVIVDVSGSSGTYRGILVTGNTFNGAFTYSMVRLLSTSGSAVLAGVTVTNNNTTDGSGGGAGFDVQFGGSTSAVSNLILGPNMGHGNSTYGQNISLPVLALSTSESFNLPQWEWGLVDASGAIKTETLPDATTCFGYEIGFKKIDASGNAVTIATVGGQTIDGAATKSLASQYKYARFKSDGINWVIVANN